MLTLEADAVVGNRRAEIALLDDNEHVGTIIIHVGYGKTQMEVQRIDESRTGSVEVTVR